MSRIRGMYLIICYMADVQNDQGFIIVRLTNLRKKAQQLQAYSDLNVALKTL